MDLSQHNETLSPGIAMDGQHLKPARQSTPHFAVCSRGKAIHYFHAGTSMLRACAGYQKKKKNELTRYDGLDNPRLLNLTEARVEVSFFLPPSVCLSPICLLFFSLQLTPAHTMAPQWRCVGL